MSGLFYPGSVSVSSTGETAQVWPAVLGLYRLTNFSHNSRPVWTNIDREMFLFYNGNTNTNTLSVLHQDQSRLDPRNCWRQLSNAIKN